MTQLALDRFRTLGILAPAIDSNGILDEALAKAGVMPLNNGVVRQKKWAVIQETARRRHLRRKAIIHLSCVALGIIGVVIGYILLMPLSDVVTKETAAPLLTLILSAFVAFVGAVSFLGGPDEAGEWRRWGLEYWCSEQRYVPASVLATAMQITANLPAARFYVVAHTTSPDPFLLVQCGNAERYLAEWEEAQESAIARSSVTVPIST